ncbi:chitooligosaccharidolytic beta-N-acetylglucosaminidase [Cephus cinctus]|uniref:Beta-hexosaminidase n=1 Tax=Cephus cinctus TaxID=211228 RepID=A0AAJ7BTJ7_CEPCN|nr:chitooligosaccharidolytic beta-N-acetylglucosaminidase [Cephus cinctus]
MFVILLLVFGTLQIFGDAHKIKSPWHYECSAGLCEKAAISSNVSTPLSLEVCQMFCGEAGAIWPKPTGHLSLGNFVVHLDPEAIKISGLNSTSKVSTLLSRSVNLLKSNVQRLGGGVANNKNGKALWVHFSGSLVKDLSMPLDISENYTLEVRQLDDGTVNATIVAESYFGARHGLETLSQLIVFDDLRSQVQIARDVNIVDGPVYPYRGITLDTSRNFIDKAAILRTIRGMAMSKLNTFHWHITDSHSFPYESKSLPNMSHYGSYTPQKVYTSKDVKEIVDYGLLHGVRVVPELDAPAHVGEGWQWIDNALLCFKAQPWMNYCVEPPCGQLNVSNEKVYEILETIYKDLIHDFKPALFHMGGDEVSTKCWNSVESFKQWMATKGWNTTGDSGFIKAWEYFQTKAYDALTRANNGKTLPSILWTSGLTDENNIDYLDPNKYIIQIWTESSDKSIARLIKKKFKVIFSNYDAVYLDCGFGAWVTSGNNWCSPYKGWQLLYDNSPLNIIIKQGFSTADKQYILGGSAALWTEQADTSSLDGRLWPRAAAYAERLWAEPSSSWIHAEQRMLRHRQRLVQKGIQADQLEPEWCSQNQGACPL